MEKNIEVSLLLDFYGELLKPTGRHAVDLYYNDDLSLSEIAEDTGITRQGVRDSVFHSVNIDYLFRKTQLLYFHYVI